MIFYFLLLIDAIKPGVDAATNFSQGVRIFFLLYGFLLAFFSVNSLVINSKVDFLSSRSLPCAAPANRNFNRPRKTIKSSVGYL